VCTLPVQVDIPLRIHKDINHPSLASNLHQHANNNLRLIVVVHIEDYYTRTIFIRCGEGLQTRDLAGVNTETSIFSGLADFRKFAGECISTEMFLELIRWHEFWPAVFPGLKQQLS